LEGLNEEFNHRDAEDTESKGDDICGNLPIKTY
jgi:hypothetical protein